MRKNLGKALGLLLLCAVLISAGLTLVSCSQPDYVEVAEWQDYIVDRSLEADVVIMGLSDILSSFGYNPIQLTESEIDGVLALLRSYNLTFARLSDSTALYETNLYLILKDATSDDDAIELFRVHVIKKTGKIIVVVGEEQFISDGAIDYSEFETYFRKEY